MEKRIRALKAIILVVVMIVELFGVDAVRVVAETINVTGDTTISTEDNRDYAVTDCTLTVSSTGNITGTVYGSGGKIVNQGSISKIERNIEVDNQAGASIQDLQSSVGITNAGHITSATYSSTYTLTNSGTIDTLNVQNPGYSGSTATVNMNAGTISSLNVTNYSGMNPVINYAGGTITSLIAEGTNGADLVVSGSHEISQLKGTVNVSGSGMLTVSGALQLEKGYTGEKLGVTKDTALTVKDGYTVQVNYKDHVYSISSATEQKITDLAGNTVSAVMDDAAAATMTVETPFTSETYMYGEQAVAVYLAKDDYYFPEDYQATVTGGSGTLDITRVNAKEIKLAYTFADEKKNIQISLPAANARGTQDAPAGLDGGVKKVTGVTEDMEYAVSETSETWTQVTGITDSGTLAMEPCTWYFRYKETDEKKVSAATKVIVKGEGVASVEQGDVNYGTDPKAETSTNTEKTAVIEYKEASSDDTAYSQTVPTAVGNYTVRATFAETEAYGEAVATTDFSIRYLETPEPPYTLVGTKGENGYYTSNVVVKPAKGYMISTELNGTYVESLTIQNSQSGTVFYLRNASGERTGALRLETIKIKKQTPKLSLENGKTYYGDSQKLVIQDDYLSQVYVNGVLQNLDGTEFVLQLGSNNGKKKYEITAVDVAGNKKTILVTVAAAWMKTGIIPEGVLVNLETGNGYKLGNGNWKVAGDSTSYSGGTEFYVKKDGSYTFGKQ